MSSNPFAPPDDLPRTSDVVTPMNANAILWSFDGRISRSTYWFYSIGTMLVFYAIIFATALIVREEAAIQLVTLVAYIPMVWASLAIQVKRWHDRDKSGWFVLIGLIPLIGPIWALVECGFMKGTTGSNQYGADPVGGFRY